ncbi:hypothetical protein L211DRAFT_868169 [Terfezia boudieri ATCC MYA-4762]|uniref:AAA+ ATPase domain-containing protein n=1 Tax=Terfezia boudieri ATCC MYA-4762 TaxID=1051890 RepID=A0A3N4LMI9_9PEZI|nr:hypothetical protein L211DRAFT_868169 [Terfezia boudieri ATCC MYA-4762]
MPLTRSMAIAEGSSKSLPMPPEMSSTTVLSKPIASIFTKEGLRKCKEQQSTTRQKRSRKKQPKSSSSAPALTPPDSAQETNQPPISILAPTPASAIKRRDRAAIGLPTGTSKSTSISTSRVASTTKGKRKKKDDGDAEFRVRGPASKTTISATSASKAEEQDTSTAVSTTVSEVGSDVNTTTIPENPVDSNHSRRKRRKKIQNNQIREVISSAGTDDAGDFVMEDTPATDSLAADSQPVGEAKAVETGQISAAPTNQDMTRPQKLLPSAKPLHPFFTLGGLTKTEAPVLVKPEVKTVHPFFAPGGMKPKPAPQTNTVTTLPILSNTTKIPKETKVISASDSIIQPAFSPTTKTALKVSGAMEAPWPNKQQRHVRQLSPTDIGRSMIESSLPYRNARKLKTRCVEISTGEDLLRNLAESLDIHGCKYKLSQPNYHEEQYFRVSSTLRLPNRYVMSGPQLQEIMRKKVSARLPTSGERLAQRVREDSVSTVDSSENEPRRVHPALLWLYSNLRDSMTPFDAGLRETALWAYKYAPQYSANVLQAGPEVKVLHDWLAKLMVDTGYEVPGVKKKKRKAKGKDGTASAIGKCRKRKKKKRVKGGGLDDFLIESEEELDEMDEISDPEDNDEAVPPPIFGALTKKSAIRTGDKNASIAAKLGYVSGGKATNGGGESGRMVNAVVISGPHGCGKTATVYAVAKEMGFTVFEVNPGSRRSGKDLLDQVGEMSRNHLVHQQKANAVDGASFFKQGNGKGKAKQIEEVIEKAQQTQSLILLEEADLLFEEDKQFWPTVMSLMAQSKRPIVMTCNDEKLLPIEDLSLHAILRMPPPPRTLMTDYLLLLAANEGHILERIDVSRLYNVHKGDLRAIITELNFWCQMGIGDRRAGLDWILTRFPVGHDISGPKRVISENSFLSGMGWIPREEADDGVSAPDCRGRKLKEDDIWKEAWNEWGVDVIVDACGQIREMEDLEVGVNGLEGYNTKILETYTEAMSDVDIYAGSAMRGLEDPILDWTQPRLPASSRVDDILGYPVLQADLWPASQTSRDTLISIATTVRSLARSYLLKETNTFMKRPPNYSFPKPNPAFNPLTAQNVTEIISSRLNPQRTATTIPRNYIRGAFSYLTAPPPPFLASNPSPSFNPGTIIIATTIHGPLDTLVLDVAPYVRSIVRHETKREEEAKSNSGLLSQGGKGGARSTRASRMAMMQGSGRSWGRKEKWFGQKGNAIWMGNTGGGEWGKAVDKVLEKKAEWAEEE